MFSFCRLARCVNAVQFYAGGSDRRAIWVQPDTILTVRSQAVGQSQFSIKQYELSTLFALLNWDTIPTVSSQYRYLGKENSAQNADKLTMIQKFVVSQ